MRAKRAKDNANNAAKNTLPWDGPPRFPASPAGNSKNNYAARDERPSAQATPWQIPGSKLSLLFRRTLKMSKGYWCRDEQAWCFPTQDALVNARKRVMSACERVLKEGDND